MQVTASPKALELGLSQLTPNPTRGMVRIEYSLPREAHIRLSIVDPQGREVSELANGLRRPGIGHAEWNGTTRRGGAPQGVYFVVLRVEDRTFVRRVALMR